MFKKIPFIKRNKDDVVKPSAYSAGNDDFDYDGIPVVRFVGFSHFFKRALKFMFVMFFICALSGFAISSAVHFLNTASQEKVLPKVIANIENEYKDIKAKYDSIDFKKYQKIISEGSIHPNAGGKPEDKVWESALPVFMGTSYIEQIEKKTGNSMSDSELANLNTQMPQLKVKGFVVRDNLLVAQVDVSGKAEIWSFEKKSGKWTTNDIPSMVELDAVNIEKKDSPYVILRYKTDNSIKFKVNLSDASVVVDASGAMSSSAVSGDVKHTEESIRRSGAYMEAVINGKRQFVLLNPVQNQPTAGAQGGTVPMNPGVSGNNGMNLNIPSIGGVKDVTPSQGQ